MRRAAVLLIALLGTCSLPAPAAADTNGPNARLAPVKTVRVPWGRISYRSVGTGPPLVLLTGGGTSPTPSIDDWPPDLIGRLARHSTVLAIDYEGVGRTSKRPGNLTIDRMANDTISFLNAMHLQRVDLLGWSMGGFVAQVVAIRHSHRIRDLVLCSSALGDGTAKPASVSGSPKYPAQWLFPFNSRNHARARAFERAVHSYPHYYEGSSWTGSAEGLDIYEWINGSVPDGHHASRISAPTLVGGGTQDVILPMPDSRALAHEIKHSKLMLYRDAGHGFLVQHEADWARRVDLFLGRDDT